MNKTRTVMQKIGMVTEHPQIRVLHPLNWIVWPPLIALKVTIGLIKAWFGVMKELYVCFRTEFCWWN